MLSLTPKGIDERVGEITGWKLKNRPFGDFFGEWVWESGAMNQLNKFTDSHDGNTAEAFKRDRNSGVSIEGTPMSLKEGGARVLPRKNGVLREIDNEFCACQEVQAQQSLDMTGNRQIMADHFHLFAHDTESFESRHKNSGDILNAASGRDFNFPMRSQRIASDRNGDFDRYHGQSGAGIESQLQGKFHATTCQRDMADNDAFCGIKLELLHPSKCRHKTFWKGIFRVIKQNFFRFWTLRKDLVDVLPVGTVGDQPSGHGRRRSFVRFINGNEQPFSMESFSDLNNRLVSHCGTRIP